MSTEFSSVMKSMLPDQAVAMTARPRLIASIRCSPRPSERCVETITSQEAYSESTSR